MAPYRPQGLLVPVVTPFDGDDQVDVDALERLAAELLEQGAAGLVALGTAGEASSLDEAERVAIVAACARVCGDANAALIVGAGTNDTRTTIARHEALAAVPETSASLALVPYYVRPSEEAIVRHFELVAARSPRPVIAYNVPYRTGRGLGADALLALTAIDNVVGVKQAVGGVDADTLALLAGAPAEFGVLSGDDPFIYPLMLMGAAGAIAASANLATAHFAALIELAAGGGGDTARSLAEALLPIAGALFAEPSPAVIKAVLHAQGRIPTPHVRMPLADASPEAAQRGAAAVSALA